MCRGDIFIVALLASLRGRREAMLLLQVIERMQIRKEVASDGLMPLVSPKPPQCAYVHDSRNK